MKRRELLTGAAAIIGASAVRTARAQTSSASPESDQPDAAHPILRIRWSLVSLARADGSVLTPADASAFTVQLLDDGRMLVRLDCNTGSGTYTLDGDTLRVDAIASTRKACDEGSLDLEIGMALAAVTRYEVVVETSDRLLLHANDGTTLTFDPTLSGVVWRFTRFQGGDGAEVFPDDPRHYTLEFGDGGVANVVADCNRGRASVALDGNRIDLSIALTRAACPPGSISMDYVRYLEEAVSWVIRDGQLHLALPMDAGIASFSPVVKGIAPDATPVAGQR